MQQPVPRNKSELRRTFLRKLLRSLCWSFARLSFPMEIRTEVSTLSAASLAHQQRLKVGQPDIIGPSIRTHPRPMAAMVVGAIDQQLGTRTALVGSHTTSGRDIRVTASIAKAST